MRMKDMLRKSFQPKWFIKVGRMEDGGPVPELLVQLHKAVSSGYATLIDSENGVIYFKEKKKGA